MTATMQNYIEGLIIEAQEAARVLRLAAASLAESTADDPNADQAHRERMARASLTAGRLERRIDRLKSKQVNP